MLNLAVFVIVLAAIRVLACRKTSNKHPGVH